MIIWPNNVSLNWGTRPLLPLRWWTATIIYIQQGIFLIVLFIPRSISRHSMNQIMLHYRPEVTRPTLHTPPSAPAWHSWYGAVLLRPRREAPLSLLSPPGHLDKRESLNCSDILYFRAPDQRAGIAEYPSGKRLSSQDNLFAFWAKRHDRKNAFSHWDTLGDGGPWPKASETNMYRKAQKLHHTGIHYRVVIA